MANRFLFIIIVLTIGASCSSTKDNKDSIDFNSTLKPNSSQVVPKIDAVASNYFDLVRPKFKGELAYNTTAYLEQFWRVVGNEGFNKSVYRIVEGLEKAGYVEASKATEVQRFTYKLLKRPLSGKTWEPVDAQISIVGESDAVLKFSSNRNMIYVNSRSTPREGIEAEVLFITEEDDIKTIDVRGKIIFAEMSAYKLIGAEIFERGALGIMTYDNPAYLQPEKNFTSIQFRHLPTKYAEEHWGIALSYSAKERLKEAINKGKNKIRIQIETKQYESEELTVVANIKGSKIPSESMVFSAHVQEPGANDNASGVGAQLEMATVAAELLKQKKIDCKRSLTFLWGDEIASTRRYIEEVSDRNPTIKWGISLDMVGENTAITGGSFLIEKMPDPSAIVTRGKDKHTEWGGRPLKESDMFPHYLNDLAQYIFEIQGKHANWEVNNNPFEGGSDHTPFLDAEIPSVLFWHFTDQFYHTDNDRLDKVSQETLTNVGVASLVTAFILVNSDAEMARIGLHLLVDSAKERLGDEFAISHETINKSNKERSAQITIITNWTNWYVKACETFKDMTFKEGTSIEEEIIASQRIIEQLGNSYKENLKSL